MNPSGKFNKLRKPFKKLTQKKQRRKPKVNSEIQEVVLESDSIIENYSEQPNYNGLKADLETAVSHYLNQVKELGIYKDFSSRDNSCQFTTFKTPALPKKVIRIPPSPGDRLLDVKFQVTNKKASPSFGTYENISPESRGLDNPIYLSLSECSTGSSNTSLEGSYKNHRSGVNSDEDHIYENVEHHVYDTVSCPPRPKLPPKPNCLSKTVKFPAPKLAKKVSNLIPKPQEISEQRRNGDRFVSNKTKNCKTGTQKSRHIHDGSETSDLGSSGSEDISEEDWSLPPLPQELSEELLEDIPLPLPPPDFALQQLEERINRSDSNKNICSKHKHNFSKEISANISDACKQTKTLLNEKEREVISGKNLDKVQSFSDEESLLRFTLESNDKKQLKRKLFTLNKGLNVYNKVSKSKDEVLCKSTLKVSEQEKNDNLLQSPTVRHSVIIELKNSADPTSLQYLPETQIKERLVPLDRTHSNGQEITEEEKEQFLEAEDKCFSVIIKGIRKTQEEFSSRAEDLNDQIIEIAEDGSWEMKTVKGCNDMTESQTVANNLQEIDPFTGLPLFTTVSQSEERVSTGEGEIVYHEPEIYFDDKLKQVSSSNLNENSLRNDVVFTKCTDRIVTSDGSDSLPALYSESITQKETKGTTKFHSTIDNKEIINIPSSQNGTNTQKLESLSSMENELNLRGESSDERQIHYDSILDDGHKPSSQLVNIGTAIMEGYERDLKRVKENLNLPEVSLLEFRDTVKDLEMQRKDVIEQMTVKAKKKDSWIRTFRTGGTNNRETLKETVKGNKDPLIVSNKKIILKPKQENAISDAASLSLGNKSTVKNEEAIFRETALNSPTKELGESHIEDLEESLGKQPSIYPSNEGLENRELTPMAQIEGIITKGEVDSGSILSQKEATKAYWKTKMLASLDDVGWEPVANVKFRPDATLNAEKSTGDTVPPPPQFSSEASNSADDFTQLGHILTAGQISPQSAVIKNERPSRQYVYGADDPQNRSKENAKQPCPSLNKDLAHENIIEAEIRAQQLREDELRRENGLKNRDKTGGASSPSSHTSDEGFVDPPIEDPPSPALTSASSVSEGFTHTLKSSQGEAIIYDAPVTTPSEYFTDRPLAPTGGLSETKIALEIRELKEREAELKTIRELREREQQLTAIRDSIPEPRTYVENEAEVRESMSTTTTPREIMEDQLISLTTTTDEGNFSECGDPGSSEDKSSDGSNSRIMSPDFQSFGSQIETRQRKVTVKPFEDDEKEVEPVYTQMKKESVIEREIRLAREREEAFRREKGFTVSSTVLITPKATQRAAITSSPPTSQQLTSITTTTFTTTAVVSDKPLRNSVEGPKRGVQHRLATTRIQQEIEETSQRERELMKAGKIKTLSEDTVDSKVTRLSDLAADHESSSSTPRPCSISSGSPFSSLNSSPSRATPNPPHSPVLKMTSSPITSPTQYTTPPINHLLTNTQPNPSPRLIRSFSTTNLSCAGAPGGLRPNQKGLMQKFIASRGKMTKSAFAPPSPSATFSSARTLSTTANGIPTRPMRVIPKATAVLRREPELETTTEDVPVTKLYRRTHTTAEEKIQEELRDMKKREEELRRLRAKTLARSQPNLASLDDVDSDDISYCCPCEDGVDSTSFLPEVNGLRTALSNPNLLDDEVTPSTTQTPQVERGIRRRSALVAQWEGRIQQTSNF